MPKLSIVSQGFPALAFRVLRWHFMQLSEVFLGLGQDNFQQLLRSISLGKLKTYQLYERLKIRMHLAKLNSESLRKSTPRFWARLEENDADFATELSQAILISHMDLIVAVLNFLGIPHEDGFFAKDLDASKYLTEGWRERVYEQFQNTYPPAILLFYLNHLGWEVAKTEDLYLPKQPV